MYDYKVIPAPKRGTKAKGVKTHEDRFSLALQDLMNTEAADGWEFTRAETLPSEEKSGFRSSTVVYRSVLVFRKAIPVEMPDVVAPAPVAAPMVAPEPVYEPAEIAPEFSDLEESQQPQDSSNASA